MLLELYSPTQITQMLLRAVVHGLQAVRRCMDTAGSQLLSPNDELPANASGEESEVNLVGASRFRPMENWH